MFDLRSLAFLLCAAGLLAAQDPVKPQPPKAEPAPKAEPKDGTEPEKARPTVLELGGTLPRAVVLPDIDGNPHALADLADKIVVVNFWSTTCPIMRGWESRLAAIVEEYEAKDVVFLMVNANEGNGEIGDREPKEEGHKPYQSIRDYLADRELPYTILVDHGSRVADLFAAQTTPDIYVFAPKGRLVYRGAIDDDQRGDKGEKTKHHLRTVLDTLVAGKTVEPWSTRSVGCGIKRPQAESQRRRPRRGDGR